MQTILVVDDEPKIATLARDYLEHAGFAVVTANDGQAALTTMQRIWPGDQERSERFRRIPFSPVDPRADARTVREWYSRGCQEAVAGALGGAGGTVHGTFDPSCWKLFPEFLDGFRIGAPSSTRNIGRTTLRRPFRDMKLW